MIHFSLKNKKDPKGQFNIIADALIGLKTSDVFIGSTTRTAGRIDHSKSDEPQPNNPTLLKKMEEGDGVPKRAVLEATMKTYQKEISKLVTVLLTKKYSIGYILSRIGIQITSYMRKTIMTSDNNRFKPLHPRTIEDRKRQKSEGVPIKSLTKPLIATGQMRDSIVYQVTKGKK